MPYSDSSKVQIVGRNNNGTSGYTFEEGDSSVGIAWTLGSSVGYRGSGCSIDRPRGLFYYGGQQSHSGNSLYIGSLEDGAERASTTDADWDYYACQYVHPNGTAFHTHQKTSSPSNIIRTSKDSKTNDTTFLKDEITVGGPSRETLYPMAINGDIMDRPERNILILSTNATDNWNSSDDDSTLYVQRYDMIDEATANLFSFDTNDYVADGATQYRTRMGKIYCMKNGDIVIAVGTATSHDGGFIARFQRDGTNVWAVGKRTFNSDVRNNQYAGIDSISRRWMYWGSGSTNDPEVVGQIDLNDGSTNGFCQTESASTGNEHRTNGALACMYGRILSTSTMERGYSQLIYFAGYGGNHNETPNFAYFDGWPGTQYDNQTNTTVIREGTTARDCHASYDANGGEQAAAMVGVINILEDNEQFERTLNTNMRMSSFNGSDANLLGGFETGGVSDFIYEEYNSEVGSGNQFNMVRHMRHGKVWVNGVQVGI